MQRERSVIITALQNKSGENVTYQWTYVSTSSVPPTGSRAEDPVYRADGYVWNCTLCSGGLGRA